MMPYFVALILAAGLLGPVGDGCKCHPPSYTTPVFGARAFSHAELGRVIGTRAILPGSPACAEAAERVRLFYARNGYAKAAVSVEPSPAGCALRVIEGKAYFVRGVEFRGNQRVRDAALFTRVDWLYGVAFSEEAITRSLERLGRVRGIQPPRRDDVEIQLDDERGTADLTIHVTES